MSTDKSTPETDAFLARLFDAQWPLEQRVCVGDFARNLEYARQLADVTRERDTMIREREADREALIERWRECLREWTKYESRLTATPAKETKPERTSDEICPQSANAVTAVDTTPTVINAGSNADPESPNPSGPQDYWEITPHRNKQWDTCVMPVAGDTDGRKALESAKETLEHLWDTAESLEELDITVRMRRVTLNPDDIDDGL